MPAGDLTEFNQQNVESFTEPPYCELISDQQDFNGDIVLKKEDTLILHGAVIDNETGEPTPGALVELYVRMKDDTEYPFCQTFSSDDGDYLLHVDKKKITGDIAAIILRASTNYSLSRTI